MLNEKGQLLVTMYKYLTVTGEITNFTLTNTVYNWFQFYLSNLIIQKNVIIKVVTHVYMSGTLMFVFINYLNSILNETQTQTPSYTSRIPIT